MKQITFIALFALLLAIPAKAQKRTVKKQVSLTESVFYIKNVQSGRYMDLPGNPGKTDNGTNVQIWDLDNGSDRKFKFVDAGDGYYYIKPQHCSNSRLDVEGCWPDRYFCNHYKNKNGAPIQIWSHDDNDVGKWKLEQVEKGRFVILNKYSGKVLDATGSGNGSSIVIWSKHSGANQQWELITVDKSERYEL